MTRMERRIIVQYALIFYLCTYGFMSITAYIAKIFELRYLYILFIMWLYFHCYKDCAVGAWHCCSIISTWKMYTRSIIGWSSMTGCLPCFGLFSLHGSCQLKFPRCIEQRWPYKVVKTGSYCDAQWEIYDSRYTTHWIIGLLCHT